jgi:hypothetical protein
MAQMIGNAGTSVDGVWTAAGSTLLRKHVAFRQNFNRNCKPRSLKVKSKLDCIGSQLLVSHQKILLQTQPVT